MTERVVYLDYAAATPMDERVFLAMQPYFSEQFYNPSSPYAPAVEVRREYQDAKQRLAQTFGATADELVMTAGATESINLAIGGFEGHKVTVATEHTSVMRAVMAGEHSVVPVDTHGHVDVEDIRRAIRDDTQLVSVALANHEIGTIQPIRAIAACIEELRHERQMRGNVTPLVLHTDASQGFGLIDIHVGRLGVDLLTLNAAKIYGPKQVGLLWVRPGIVLRPRILGGGQEAGLRSGTENVAGTIGFACAAQLASQKRSDETRRLAQLRDDFEHKLTAAFPEAILSGHRRHRLANFCHISFPGLDAERLVFMLETEQVLVATGSACAANSGTRSSVLTAIGLRDDQADGSIRVTLGRGSDEQTMEYAAEQLIRAVTQEMRRVEAAR